MENKWYEILNIVEKYGKLNSTCFATHITKSLPNNDIYSELNLNGLIKENEKLHFWRGGKYYHITLFENISPKKIKEKEKIEIQKGEYLNYKRTELIDKILNEI
jgi:hypothetical protein